MNNEKEQTEGFWEPPSDTSQVNEPAAQPLGFRDPPANLAPPSQQPTQAGWLKMVAMLDNLNQMMKEMRETSRFL